MEDAAPTAKAVRWPYTSWKTVLNLIQKFEADGGALPPRIDRSVLGGSEGQKTQVMATLRFLGLIGENGEVTPTFQKLVSADDNARKPLVRELLKRHYPDATKLGSENATTKQLEETFTGLQSDTLRKAMTFYIHASKYSGNPLSKHFKTPSGFRSSAAKKPKALGAGAGAGTSQLNVPPSPPASDAKARYIEMLLDKASKAEDLDTTLLDRIEKLLGYPNGGDNA